jgi:mannose-6-phosphate isomerase-like protein (cupin superfamily)
MRMQSFFGGKALIRPLLLTDQPATRPEVRARLAGPKGEMVVLADTGQVIRHLAYLEFLPDRRRGDHYHKLRLEHFYLISGNISLLLEEIATGTKATVDLAPGDFGLIHPGIAHTFVPCSPGQGLEFAAEPFDLSDVYPHAISG